MEPQPLLTRYLRSGSSADFERMVQAHGAMVFNTALRSIRNRALAEEVTQEVFTILARKAEGIREPHKLAAWLHRTAIRCAYNTNRRETKRRRAMETYSDEVRSLKFDSEENEAAWQRALPHLDQAIEELPSTDREAVIMRFYERSSFRDIAQLLNKSESSCRKQVSRALDKLAGLLKKRGVIVPPTVLGVGLGGYLAQDALPMAAGQITQLALAAKSSAGVTVLTQTLLIMSGYKLTLIAASLAALIPIGLQWQANRAQAAAVSQSSMRPDAITGSLPPKEQASDDAIPNAHQPRTSDELLAEMHALHQSGESILANAKLRHLMFGLRHDEMEAAFEALDDFVNSPGTRSASFALANALFAHWAGFDATEASRFAMEIQRKDLRGDALNGMIQSWIKTDRESLEAFIEEQPPGRERIAIESNYWRHFVDEDPKAAADKAMAIADGNEQTELLNRLIMYSWHDPGSALEWLEEKVEESPTRDGWLDRMLGSLAHREPAAAFEKSIRLLNGTQQKSTLRRVVEHWAYSDPEPALAAVLELPDGVRDGHIIEALGKGLSDFSFLDSCLEQLPGEPERTAFVNGVASGLPDSRHEMRNVTPENIEQVRQLVEALPPGEDRFSARWNLAAAWAGLNYEQARDWYHSQPGVKESMKEKFVRLNTQ